MGVPWGCCPSAWIIAGVGPRTGSRVRCVFLSCTKTFLRDWRGFRTCAKPSTSLVCSLLEGSVQCCTTTAVWSVYVKSKCIVLHYKHKMGTRAAGRAQVLAADRQHRQETCHDFATLRLEKCGDVFIVYNNTISSLENLHCRYFVSQNRRRVLKCRRPSRISSRCSVKVSCERECTAGTRNFQCKRSRLSRRRSYWP